MGQDVFVDSITKESRRTLLEIVSRQKVEIVVKAIIHRAKRQGDECTWIPTLCVRK